MSDRTGSTESYPPTERSKLRRNHKRGQYDRETVHGILDAWPICHVGYVIDGQPYVTPTIHWRDGERVYWHGSSASRMLRTVKTGVPVCLTVTLFDGFVLARSAFNHTANFRSVMVFGNAEQVEGKEEKERALHHMMEHYFPGRQETLRPNTLQEIKATTVVGMTIEDACAKVRTGPPGDDEEDIAAVGAWAGVFPMSHGFGTPLDAPNLRPGISAPDYGLAKKYR